MVPNQVTSIHCALHKVLPLIIDLVDGIKYWSNGDRWTQQVLNEYHDLLPRVVITFLREDAAKHLDQYKKLHSGIFQHDWKTGPYPLPVIARETRSLRP